MRFGHMRGVIFAVALVSALGSVRSASADAFGHTMPKEILARDLNTGEPYFAPPIPWGHYAKDGLTDHFFPKKCGLCGLLLGKGQGTCLGHGLLGKGHFGHGSGHFGQDDGNVCGKKGCGLFHKGSDGCGDPGCGSFQGGHGRRLKDCGLCKGKGCGLCRSSVAGDPFHSLASEQTVRMISPQSTSMVSSQACVLPGCKLGKGHRHGGVSSVDPCGSCGGKGCGLCGGHGVGANDLCGGCGGKGCGLCGGLGKLIGKHGNKCSNCGGKGCGLCGGLGGLKGKLSGLLHPHKGNIKYFVGPGGPVPLTPGYVPYIVTTRSPRDFLAFPPYTPDGF